MKRFSSALTVLAGLATCLFIAEPAFAKISGSPDQPNFIIILADDLGYGDVGFTGSTQIQTPHIDALAADGVIFEQGYVSAPVCGPSRAGLMTGRNQVNFGFDNNPNKSLPQFNKDYLGLPVGETTMADR
ncbi:MAG: sulfatase-like hydrolase/transferase, partial [Gammaproteobacteria bacterium]|nr:sulfatase-like hydrolase/transferase [Gammaproteobacteria bacterium]